MKFTEKDIAGIVAEYYGIQVNVKELNGYDELNFRLTDKTGAKYICKIATEQHGPYFLDAQVKILQHLADTASAEGFQKVLLNLKGNAITILQSEAGNHYLRILTWLDGIPWVDSGSRTKELFHSLGTFLGKMDHALTGFSHPAMHRHYEWDIANASDAESRLHFITDPERRRIAAYFLMMFQEEVVPVMPQLRKAYIHSDANDYNVLVSNGRVSGLIDFGDMVYSHLVNNLAIACTYAMFGEDDPVAAAAEIVKGYHHEFPLTETEISVLYYLIAARLCISVTGSAHKAATGSTNEHHFITEIAAWDLLCRLIRINPLKAHHTFRLACGYPGILGNKAKHQSLEAERKQIIGKNLSISYKEHLKIVRGALQYLYDDLGNTYVDCVNNVSHVGHCHPEVVKAISRQAAKLNTNTRYLHDNLVEYARKLTAKLPSKLKVCYFTNSGSEANDLAIRISRFFTKQEDVIVLDHAYHGTSTVAIEMSPYKFDGWGGSGQKPYIHKAMNPDLYRGNYRYGDSQAGEKYAADIQRIVDELKAKNKGVAAFICETLLGVGGQIPLPPGYLKEAYRIVKAAGGICIADEVQVGFGRVGEKFWGFELQDAEPDMVVLGKPIGNGHPLAAVVMTEEIADAFNNGMEYFNTFGGNPVSMAAGLAVLNVIEDEQLQENALRVGRFFLEQLQPLREKHKIIGDIRGKGLFIGVELVRNHLTLEPAVPEIDQVVEKMKERGFLISTDGPLNNVLKIKPPIVFSMENAAEFVRNLDKVLEECAVQWNF